MIMPKRDGKGRFLPVGKKQKSFDIVKILDTAMGLTEVYEQGWKNGLVCGLVAGAAWTFLVLAIIGKVWS